MIQRTTNKTAAGLRKTELSGRRISTDITKNPPNVFPEFHKKFSTYLEKPSNSYSLFKNKLILIYLGRMFQTFQLQ